MLHAELTQSTKNGSGVYLLNHSGVISNSGGINPSHASTLILPRPLVDPYVPHMARSSEFTLACVLPSLTKHTHIVSASDGRNQDGRSVRPGGL